MAMWLAGKLSAKALQISPIWRCNILQKYFATFAKKCLQKTVMVEKHGPGKIYSSRLSNGPIESLNRKVKDLKRLGRGYRNFEHFRTRFLFATRDNPVINGVTDYNPVTYFNMED